MRYYLLYLFAVGVIQSLFSFSTASWIPKSFFPFRSLEDNAPHIAVQSGNNESVSIVKQQSTNISTTGASKSFVQPQYNSTINRKASTKPFVIVTFVNGIYHSVEDWVRISNNLESIFKCEVRPFYNPTSGWWVKDISKAGFDLVLRPNDLMLAKELSDHLRSALSSLHPNGRLLHIAHSGGAILTYLAAKHHLTYQEIARIDVATMGGGKSITHKYFKGWVRNYYARNDPLTIVDTRANKLLKRSGNTPVSEIRDAKHNTSFVYIEPLEKNPISDHSMECRTYAIALKLEAEALYCRLLDITKQHAREVEWSRRIRKQAANATGLHHFWDRYLPDKVLSTTRGARKKIARWTGLRGFFSKKYDSNEDSVIIQEQEIMDNAQKVSDGNSGAIGTETSISLDSSTALSGMNNLQGTRQPLSRRDSIQLSVYSDQILYIDSR